MSESVEQMVERRFAALDSYVEGVAVTTALALHLFRESIDDTLTIFALREPIDRETYPSPSWATTRRGRFLGNVWGLSHV